MVVLHSTVGFDPIRYVVKITGGFHVSIITDLCFDKHILYTPIQTLHTQIESDTLSRVTIATLNSKFTFMSVVT